MNEISKVQEALENTRRAVLVESNEGLDSIYKLDSSDLSENNKLKIMEIENSLREILRIMNR